jgi:hypothetical protein
MSEMTRRHFELIAKVLREQYLYNSDIGPDDEVVVPIDGLVRAFVEKLTQTNSNFDREKFMKACYGETEKV